MRNLTAAASLPSIKQSFDNRKKFLLLSEKDEQALKTLHSALGDGLPSFVEDFYRHLLSFPEMRALIPDEDTLDRLKRAQVNYFNRLTSGTYDEAYGSDRERVGLAHARIGLPPGWYLSSYSHYLCELIPRIVKTATLNSEEHTAILNALTKVIFLDIGIALDTYVDLRDQLIADLRDYSAAFAHLPYGTVVVNADLRVLFANQSLAMLLGCEPGELTNTNLTQWMDTTLFTALSKQIVQTQHASRLADLELKNHRLPVPVAINAHLIPATEALNSRILFTLEDLRKQERLQRDLKQAQEVAHVGTWQTLFDGHFHITGQTARLLGHETCSSLTAEAIVSQLRPEDQQRTQAEWSKGIKEGQAVFTVGINNVDPPRWLEVRCQFDRDSDGRLARAYGTVLDITERYLAEQRMRHLALTDGLTGLANRKHGIDQVQHLLDHAQTKDQQVLVMVMDLDHFKEINDRQGHGMGDQVLQAVAQLIQAHLRSDDVFARIGGDEFLIAQRQPIGEDPLRLPRQIRKLLARSLHVKKRPFGLSCSIGITVYPDQGQTVNDLLLYADLALYQVKKTLRGRSLLYSNALGKRQQRKMEVAQRLESALAQAKLELYYQPKVNLLTGELCGVEALVRWHDAEWGWVSPAEFIPIAEEKRLIYELDLWSLETAARQWRAWSDASLPLLPTIAVNISALEFSLVDGFAEQALSLVTRHGVPPQAIELEITETASTTQVAQAFKTAKVLSDMGFSLAIDDFGTGYSSLTRLLNLPLSRLKIDIAFIRTMLTDSNSQAIVSMTIAMARALKLKVVAEGVETQAQLEALCSFNCDEGQGYLFSKPIPANKLETQWLRVD